MCSPVVSADPPNVPETGPSTDEPGGPGGTPPPENITPAARTLFVSTRPKRIIVTAWLGTSIDSNRFYTNTPEGRTEAAARIRELEGSGYACTIPNAADILECDLQDLRVAVHQDVLTGVYAALVGSGVYLWNRGRLYLPIDAHCDALLGAFGAQQRQVA